MRNILMTCFVVICSGILLTSGCGVGGSTDALFTYEGKIEILPKTEVHVGGKEDSAEIAKTASQANVLRTAMKEEVVKDSEGLAQTAGAMGF